MQLSKNPESSTVNVFIWVLSKVLKLFQKVEFVCNYHFRMRVQNGSYKSVATSWMANEKYEGFNAIILSILLDVLFPFNYGTKCKGPF